MAAHHHMVGHVLVDETSSNGLPRYECTEALEDKAAPLHPVEYTARDDADSLWTNGAKTRLVTEHQTRRCDLLCDADNTTDIA